MFQLAKNLLGLAALSYLVAGVVYNFGFKTKHDTQEFLCRSQKGLPVHESGIGNVMLWPWLLGRDRAQATALAACGDALCRHRVLRPSCGPEAKL